MTISQISYSNYQKTLNVRKNNNLKDNPQIPKKQVAFKGLEKVATKTMPETVKNNGGKILTFLTGLLGLTAINKKTNKGNESLLQDYKITLPDSYKIKLPNSEVVCVRDILNVNGNETYGKNLVHEENYLAVVGPKTSKEELEEIFPRIQKIKKNLYYLPNQDKKMDLSKETTFFMNEKGEIYFESSRLPEYLIDEASLLAGKTKVMAVPKNKKVFGCTYLPDKFMVVPKGAYINFDTKYHSINKSVKEDSIVVASDTKAELLSFYEFFLKYSPTISPKSEAMFEELLKEHEQKNISTYTTKNGTEIKLETRDGDTYYRYKNLTINKSSYLVPASSGVGYSTDYIVHCTLEDSDLENIIQAYEKALEEKPYLKNYDITLTIPGAPESNKKDCDIKFYKKDSKPWEKKSFILMTTGFSGEINNKKLEKLK